MKLRLQSSLLHFDMYKPRLHVYIVQNSLCVDEWSAAQWLNKVHSSCVNVIIVFANNLSTKKKEFFILGQYRSP